jgi:hypothetical protein
VILRVAQNARIDVTLQVGDAHQEVTVHGEGLAQVDTESSQLGGTISGKELTQLELIGRNFTQLITLVPGVSKQTGQDEGVVGAEGSIAYSVNGGRSEYNNWEVDGGDMMDNGSNFSLNVYPAQDQRTPHPRRGLHLQSFVPRRGLQCFQPHPVVRP